MSKKNSKQGGGGKKDMKKKRSVTNQTLEATTTVGSQKKVKKSKQGSVKGKKSKQCSTKVPKKSSASKSPLREDRRSGEKPEKTTMTNNSGSGKKKEKWVGEEAALTWVNGLAALNLMDEFKEIQKVPTMDDKCRIWQANMDRNRNMEYKCYDDNRVVVQCAKKDYINGSKINISDFKRKVYLLQIPKLDLVDAVEEFWRVVFHDQCTSVHLIMQPSELSEGVSKLFSTDVGGYLYANGFFINTRKFSKSNDKMDIYVVELLPEGCSNSVMCTVYVHSYWKAQGGPEKFHAPIKAAQMIAKPDIEDNPVVIASTRGSGRNAALLTLAVIVSQFNNKTPPNIKEIVKSIRQQRPLAVDSVTQYISLFLAVSWLVKAKISGNPDMLSKLKKFRSKCDPSSSQMSITTG